MKRKRGNLLIVALELIGNSVISVAELLDILTSDYATLRKMTWGNTTAAPGTKAIIREIIEAIAGDFRDQKKIRNLIYRLRQDGLVAEKSARGKTRLILTDAGKEKRSSLLVWLQRRPRYVSEKSNELVVVSFDVPERERQKRTWLRIALTDLGMTCAQQSLWVGKVKIPKSFLADLIAKELDFHVEIFSVSGTGTLRKFSEKSKTE